MGFQVLNGQFSLMKNINEIEELIKLISKLPGLGPKSAKRIVLKLMNSRDEHWYVVWRVFPMDGKVSNTVP